MTASVWADILPIGKISAQMEGIIWGGFLTREKRFTHFPVVKAIKE